MATSDYSVAWSLAKKRRHRTRRVALSKSSEATAGLKCILGNFPVQLPNDDAVVTVGVLRKELLALAGAMAAFVSAETHDWHNAVAKQQEPKDQQKQQLDWQLGIVQPPFSRAASFDQSQAIDEAEEQK